jgi:hypothetical protein
MSNATVSRKASRSARNSAIDAASADAATDLAKLTASAPAVPTDPAPIPTDAAPTLQETIAGAGSTAAPVSGDTTTDRKIETTTARSVRLYTESLDRLDANFADDIRGTVAQFIRNGEEILTGIDAKLLPSTNEPERKANRAAAFKGQELTASIRFTAAGENTPKLARMILVAATVRLFPEAAKLANPAQIEALGAVVTRDNPVSWNGPETYSVKPQYDRDSVAALVGSAIEDRTAAVGISAELDRIGGLVDAVPPKPVVSDPMKKGAESADSVWAQIQNRDNPEKPGIDGFAFFTRFVEVAQSRGFTIAPTNDAKGNPTFKMVKTTR